MDARLGFAAAQIEYSSCQDSHPGERLIESHEWPAIAEAKRLTIREWEVVVLLFNGNTREAIARQLCIKPRTVRQYIEQIHDKLDVRDRVELVLQIVECRDDLRVLEHSG